MASSPAGIAARNGYSATRPGRRSADRSPSSFLTTGMTRQRRRFSPDTAAAGTLTTKPAASARTGSSPDISLTVPPRKDAAGNRRRVEDRQRHHRAPGDARKSGRSCGINEIQHRIKNTLATVQAIATQTLRSSPEERNSFVARLHALAGAHDLLIDDNWHQAALSDLVAKALNAFRDKHRERFYIEGPDGSFSMRRGRRCWSWHCTSWQRTP